MCAQARLHMNFICVYLNCDRSLHYTIYVQVTIAKKHNILMKEKKDSLQSSNNQKQQQRYIDKKKPAELHVVDFGYY